MNYGAGVADYAAFDDLHRVEAPDGRFWTVHHHVSLLSSIVEARTEALPCERYRWKIAGFTRGRSAAHFVARALRTGTDPTPDNATLVTHTVDARVLPPTGNVTLV